MVNKLYLATFDIRNGESEYVIKHTVRAENIDRAEEIALFYARDFWGHAESAEPKHKQGNNWGWYSPDGGEAISYKGIGEVTPEDVVRELEIFN